MPPATSPYVLPHFKGWTWREPHLTLLKTMSTSVVVTFLPSTMRQSLHIFAKFLPFISFPVALVSPCTANLWKDCSTSARDTGGAAILTETQAWTSECAGKHRRGLDPSHTQTHTLYVRHILEQNILNLVWRFTRLQRSIKDSLTEKWLPSSISC